MRYRERVRVPPAWWVLAALFALSLLVAFGFYLGPVTGVGVGVATMAVAALAFSTTAFTIEVDDTALRVGRAVIGREYLAGATALDAAAARRRTEVDADARAHLVLRPWLATAVELTLDDPADPVPYWLVCTRRPAALARALTPTAAGDAVPGRPVAEPGRP